MKVLIKIIGVITLASYIIAAQALTKLTNNSQQIIESAIVTYKDFPKNGVDFWDISGILKNPAAFRQVIDNLTAHYQQQNIQAILALDARGFLFATPLAYKLNIPVIMVRKPGKLPGETLRSKFTKEYGQDILEMQKTALQAKQRVIIIDDLLATGGTLNAAIKLAKTAGAKVVSVAAIIELTKFKKIRNLDVPEVYSVIKK